MELRTVLIGLVVALCIYIAWLAMKWRRVARKAKSAGYDDKHANVFRDVDRFGAIPVGGQGAGAPSVLPDDDDDGDDSVVSLSSHASEPEPVVRAPRPSEPDASGFGFEALLEVRQMRHLVDELRTQHGRLSDDVQRLRNELMALCAASRVAPAYAEAVSMVERGLDAQAIAERCGISVAEAELVRALSETRGSSDAVSAAVGEAAPTQHDNSWDQDSSQNKNTGDRHD